MKTNFTIKIITFVCGSIIFASAIAAQEKPEVEFFADVNVTDKETNIDRLAETLLNFTNRLKSEPETTTGFINVPPNLELGKKVKAFVANEGMASRIGYSDAAKYPKYHNYSTIYFLIIPKGAKLPNISVLQPCICPSFEAVGTETVTDGNNILTFSVKVGDGDIEGLKHNWIVSDGKIIEGQGTKTIKVDAEDAREVTATVQTVGFCTDCQRTTSFTTKILK